MKIIFVHNFNDAGSTQTLQASKNSVASSAIAPTAEFYECDFMDLKSIVPVTACPSVFVGLDELVGNTSQNPSVMSMDDLIAGIQAAETVIQNRIAARVSVPVSLTASAVSGGSSTLTWQANPTASATLTGYKVYKSTDGGKTWDAGSSVGNVLTYGETGLVTGTAYTFGVTAVGNGWESAKVTVQVQA